MKMERSVLSLLHDIICHFKNEKKSKVSPISSVESLLETILLLVFRFVSINGPISDCEMSFAPDFFSFLK